MTASRFVFSADGQRLLFVQPPNSGDRPEITVVLNWLADAENKRSR
jgi:hypothetical protein